MRSNGAGEETALKRGLTWLEPRDGLAIDAETWRVAHGYHIDADRSHNLAAHGAGVLAGLNVVPVGGMELGIFPGVGIDPLGRFLVVPTRMRLRVEENVSATGMAYVVVFQAPLSPGDDGRAKEETVLQVVTAPPSEPYIELARIVLGAGQGISYPEDPVDPRGGEIDTRYRLIAGGHARGEVAVAEIAFPDAGEAHTGVAALIARAINLDGVFHARFVGRVQPGDTLPDATILYSSGNREFSVTSGIANWLKAFLDAGGTLVGDGCHAVPADPFGSAFDKLSRDVNRQMRRLVAGERLLMAHHLFGAPPPGLAKADSGLVLAGGGVIYMASDFGCVLGGVGDPAPARSTIRASEEFATNLAANAHERATVTSFLE
jgi:hypothetical protein